MQPGISQQLGPCGSFLFLPSSLFYSWSPLGGSPVFFPLQVGLPTHLNHSTSGFCSEHLHVEPNIIFKTVDIKNFINATFRYICLQIRMIEVSLCLRLLEFPSSKLLPSAVIALPESAGKILLKTVSRSCTCTCKVF